MHMLAVHEGGGGTCTCTCMISNRSGLKYIKIPSILPLFYVKDALFFGSIYPFPGPKNPCLYQRLVRVYQTGPASSLWRTNWYACDSLSHDRFNTAESVCVRLWL